LDQINRQQSVTDTNVTATNEQTISPTSVKWSDPRPDLTDDAEEWQLLMAMIEDRELHSMFDSLREVGTILERQQKMYRIRPMIDPIGKRGWESIEQFNEMKRHLMPFVGTVEALMMQLHRRCGTR
jgi:hypothetical protein